MKTTTTSNLQVAVRVEKIFFVDGRKEAVVRRIASSAEG